VLDIVVEYKSTQGKITPNNNIFLCFSWQILLFVRDFGVDVYILGYVCVSF
jgi:hypothetical protein